MALISELPRARQLEDWLISVIRDSLILDCDRRELRGNKKSFRTAINWRILSNRAHFPLALNAGDEANWFQNTDRN